MAQRWVLPGPQYPLLIAFSHDTSARRAHLRAPVHSVIQMLARWLITSKPALQEMCWAVSGTNPVARRWESEAQIKGRLAQAFQFGILWAFELRDLVPNIEAPPSNLSLPEELPDARTDVKHLTTSLKISKALQLSWKSWPEQVGQTALESFSDPSFILTLIGITTIYVGLWLTPDPTMLTKVLAGLLTAALLAQFAWEDIYGLAKEWVALEEACERATTQTELQAAGDTFARKVGQAGFDILLFLVMWRAGKQVQPKLHRVGVKRALAQAEARVEAAASQPGSGRVQPAQAESLKELDKARTRVPSPHPTPTQVLDALGQGLSDAAQRGLIHLRNRLGDSQALARLENVLLRGGKDLNSFLSHEGVPPVEAATAKSTLLKAQKELARIRMIEMKVLWDPTLRKAARTEMISYFVRLLRSLGISADWLRIQEFIRTRDIAGLIGELGEALQRALLTDRYPPSGGNRIFANVEIVREVKGFHQIGRWQMAERTAGRTGDPGGLYEAAGKLWKSITEVDALVAQKGIGGQWRPVELEQMKTGNNDQPIRAQQQNTRALEAMQEIADGSKEVRIFDRASKNKLGEDLSSQFDLSALQNVNRATRGLRGKGFDRDIPFLRELLQEVASAMVEQGLPPETKLPVPPINNEWRSNNKAAR